MEFVILALIVLALVLGAPLGLVVAYYRMRTRVMILESALDEQERRVARLVTDLARLRDDVAARPLAGAETGAPAGTAPRSAPAPAAAAAPPATRVPPAASPVAKRPVVAPPPPPPAVTAAPRAGAPPAGPPAASVGQPTPVPAGTGAFVGRPPAAPPAPAVPSAVPDAAPPREAPAFDWESLVGVKLFSAVAGIALVVAALFFLSYSIQQGWLQPPVRVLIGVAVAVTLLVVCELKVARAYAATANALDAAAIAILFATFFAAHALWRLIPAAAAFLLLGAVTALAVLLSIRRQSLFIAVLGLLGGFATPALLSTGENRPIPLFAYLGLLNVGLAWVAYRQAWPVLTGLSLVLTTAYQWVWVFRFLGTSDVPVAVGIFAIFPVVTVAALLLGRRGLPRDGGGGVAAFESTAVASAALPLAFIAHLAAVPAYAAHPGLLFGFLLFVDAGLLTVSIALGRPALHALGAVATLFVWAVWLTTSYRPDARALATALTAAFMALYLLAPLGARRAGAAWAARAGGAVLAAPALLFVFAVIARIDPSAAAPWPFFAPFLLLVLFCAWRAVAMDRGSVFFTASFFAAAAEAVWSATHLTRETLAGAVAVYAVFGVMAAAVPVIARRGGRAFAPASGGGGVLLASLGLLAFLSQGDLAPTALWALALLLAVLNAALFVESGSSRLPLVAQVGSVLSWAALAAWWVEAAAAVGVLPSLAVATALALVTLAGHAWAFGSAGAAQPAGARHGFYLGLIGHLFLFVAASSRAWVLPAAPFFAALAVITLATSVTAAFVRAPMLHAAGTAATALVIAGWTAAAGVMPATLLGLAASGVLSLFAFVWIAVGRHVSRPGLTREAAAAALAGSELTAALAWAAMDPPPYAAVLAAHAVNVTLLLVLAHLARWTGVALAAAALASLALLQWGSDARTSWQQLLTLAVAFYAVCTAYALTAGPRQPEKREPWLVALAGAAMAFFAARAAFVRGGLESVIGVVPVAQGLVSAGLLRALLRMERPEARDTTRLTLVAGAALAFVTVAIPLQLDHQWVTIGWAAEAAALAWLYRRVPHRGALAATVLLFGVVFARLTLDPGVLRYEPRGTLRILNWYLYTYAAAAGTMLGAAWLLRDTDDRPVPGLPRIAHLLPAAAVILLFVLLNIEIADYYAAGPDITFRFGSTVSQDLTYTIGWLAFGILLLAAGIALRSRPARMAAVVLIAVTTFKCFLYDLRSLEGLYRVGSFVGLAVALALVSLALQKYVLARPREVR